MRSGSPKAMALPTASSSTPRAAPQQADHGSLAGETDGGTGGHAAAQQRARPFAPGVSGIRAHGQPPWSVACPAGFPRDVARRQAAESLMMQEPRHSAGLSRLIRHRVHGHRCCWPWLWSDPVRKHSTGGSSPARRWRGCGLARCGCVPPWHPCPQLGGGERRLSQGLVVDPFSNAQQADRAWVACGGGHSHFHRGKR